LNELFYQLHACYDSNDDHGYSFPNSALPSFLFIYFLFFFLVEMRPVNRRGWEQASLMPDTLPLAAGETVRQDCDGGVFVPGMAVPACILALKHRMALKG
jgi:hypothetical protein